MLSRDDDVDESLLSEVCTQWWLSFHPEEVESIQESTDHEHRRRLIEWFIEHDFASEVEARSFYAYNIFGTFAAIACVAIIAGLFLGLLTLDEMDLHIIARSSLDEDEREHAKALIPIVKERHLLLVTLLIANALAYETLPLYLDQLVPSWMVVFLSTTLVLLFGEIIPTAIFTGPSQLALGYHSVPLVKVLLIIFYPMAKPCSMLLDRIVHGPDGHPDPTMENYNRDELAALVKIQYEQRTKRKSQGATAQRFFLRPFSPSSDANIINNRTNSPHHYDGNYSTNSSYHAANDSHSGTPYSYNSSNNNNNNTNGIPSSRAATATWSDLKQEMLEVVNERNSGQQMVEIDVAMAPPMEKQEVDVVVEALELKTKTASDVFTPLRQVYAVPSDLVLDKEGLTEIYAQGYSRVPVYTPDPNDPDDHSRIMGFLMTRQLMLIDWDHEREVNTLPLMRPDAVSPRRNLVSLLKLLRTGGSHMVFVCARPDLANRALMHDKPIPVEAGFMGLVTLEDILESILQTRIYDEGDIRERDRAVATLTRWAAEKLQDFARKRVRQRRSIIRGGSHSSSGDNLVFGQPDVPGEQTPLLQQSNTQDNETNQIAYV